MGYKHNIDEIIDVGIQLMRKRGYNDVGINDILKEAGIPKGSFYNFFDSKEDFGEQVMTYYGQESLQMLKDHLAEDGKRTSLERLKDFYSMAIETNVKDGMNSGCLINNLSVEMGGTNDTLAKKAEEVFRQWIIVVSECVIQGQEEGEIRNDIPALDIAEYIHAGIYGAFSRMKVNRNRIFLDKWYHMTFDFISN